MKIPSPTMKLKYIGLAAAYPIVTVLLVLKGLTVPLVSNGKVVAVAKLPFALPWSDTEPSVYTGKTKLFGLWGGAFECPLYIHPFADGQRFLCIDDDDTSVLVFVVDLMPSATNAPVSSGWPPNDYLRGYMAGRITNVVMNTKGLVRLPNFL